jgi:transcriptional regulator with XRE-family HTH domain
MAEFEAKETMAVRARVLGVILRQAREAAGKSIGDLARVMGCSIARVKAYEFGDRAPTLPELELAAYYLHMPLVTFFQDGLSMRTSRHVEDPVPVIAVRQRIIGALLHQARAHMGLKLSEVSRAVGITSHMLRLFELGDRPVPVPVLERLAEELQVDLQSYFRDGWLPEMADADAQLAEFERFQSLPPDVRRFVTSPLNSGYLQVAVNMSSMSAERLRAIAEALLDITY